MAHCCKPQIFYFVFGTSSWLVFQLDHSITSHRKLDPEEEAWDKVSKDATAKAKELEIVSLRLAKVEYDDSPFWMCGKCTAHSNLPRRDVISHLRRRLSVFSSLPLEFIRFWPAPTRHSVKHAVDEKDIYRKIDSPPMLLKPVLLLSDSLKRERLKPQELDWLSEGRAGFHSFWTSWVYVYSYLITENYLYLYINEF